jgi:hypothetical protein
MMYENVALYVRSPLTFPHSEITAKVIRFVSQFTQLVVGVEMGIKERERLVQVFFCGLCPRPKTRIPAEPVTCAHICDSTLPPFLLPV